MRTFVGSDQSYLIVDTTKRQDSVMVILKATDATPIYWSQERVDMESNLDAGGNPQAGMIMRDTDPPLVLIGAQMVVWARCAGGASTRIECQIVAQKVGVTGQVGRTPTSPGAAPPVKRGPISTVKLPGFENSWTRKAGVQ